MLNRCLNSAFDLSVADVAACQIHSAALTEEEIQETVVDIRGYLARKGISV